MLGHIVSAARQIYRIVRLWRTVYRAAKRHIVFGKHDIFAALIRYIDIRYVSHDMFAVGEREGINIDCFFLNYES